MSTLLTLNLREYPVVVGEVLRELREDHGWSLHDVRHRTANRIMPSTLGSWERGDRNVSLERLFDLARLYQVSPDVLISVIEKRCQG